MLSYPVPLLALIKIIIKALILQGVVQVMVWWALVQFTDFLRPDFSATIIILMVGVVVGSLALLVWLYPLYGSIYARIDWLRQHNDCDSVHPQSAMMDDSAVQELSYLLQVLLRTSVVQKAQSRAEAEALQCLLKRFPIPLLMTLADGTVTHINALAKYAFPRLQAGKHVGDYFSHPEIRLLLQKLRYVMIVENCDCGTQTLRADFRHEDPQMRHYHVDVLIVDAQQCLWVCQDRSVLQQHIEQGSEFVANVSHELRTPLTSVLGFAESLRGRDLTRSQQSEVLDILVQQSGRMAALVEDLLTLSGLEQSHQVPEDLVDLADLVKRECAALVPMLSEYDVKLDNQLPDSAVLLLADDARLGQVVRNLLVNAIKYGRPARQPARIVLSVSPLSFDNPDDAEKLQGLDRQAEYLSLSISDNGEGIAAHHIPHLTERFYRVDRHRSRQTGGTGLGLAITAKVMENHQGRLHITSVLGKGSTFFMVLPLLLDETNAEDADISDSSTEEGTVQA